MIKLSRSIKDWRTTTSEYEALIFHVFNWVRIKFDKVRDEEYSSEQSHDVP
jgi:hypothetical protein